MGIRRQAAPWWWNRALHDTSESSGPQRTAPDLTSELNKHCGRLWAIPSKYGAKRMQYVEAGSFEMCITLQHTWLGNSTDPSSAARWWTAVTWRGAGMEHGTRRKTWRPPTSRPMKRTTANGECKCEEMNWKKRNLRLNSSKWLAGTPSYPGAAPAEPSKLLGYASDSLSHSSGRTVSCFTSNTELFQRYSLDIVSYLYVRHGRSKHELLGRFSCTFPGRTEPRGTPGIHKLG